jgi:HPt (histidine-containing phosphotransfer) domain-containing protein
MVHQGESALLDMDQLKSITMDDPALMHELVIALVEDTSKQIVEISQAIESSDATRCSRLAHYVKGACANVGAASMAAILKHMEIKATLGDFDACRSSLDNLSAELRKFSVQSAAI